MNETPINKQKITKPESTYDVRCGVILTHQEIEHLAQWLEADYDMEKKEGVKRHGVHTLEFVEPMEITPIREKKLSLDDKIHRVGQVIRIIIGSMIGVYYILAFIGFLYGG